MFRFPLRTEQQAQASKISKQVRRSLSMCSAHSMRIAWEGSYIEAGHRLNVRRSSSPKKDYSLNRALVAIAGL